MPYLIDGHNLIPKAGLKLESADDELELIALLQHYSRTSRKTLEVYFDGAPEGWSGAQRFGQVTAHFVSQRATADAAIVERLSELGRAARNWTVVSSDRGVRRAAEAVHAMVERSEDFAARLTRRLPSRPHSGRREKDEGMTEEEVKRWLEFFTSR